MTLTSNPAGGYRFLALDGPYSGGAIADPGFDMAHARFEMPVPLAQGLAAAVGHVKAAGRPALAIAGFELRIPEPFKRQDFESFNVTYISHLRELGLEVDGRRPPARTNVAPTLGGVSEPSVYAVSYTVPASGARRGFVVSGAAEDGPGDAGTMLDSIVRQISERLDEMGASWDDATDIQWYGEEDVQELVVDRVLRRVDRAVVHGIRWFPSRPPIDDLRLEIDVRSAGTELVLPFPG